LISRPRIGFEWLQRCLECKHSCPLMGGCDLDLVPIWYDYHNNGYIQMLKCTGYEFDGIDRDIKLWLALIPDACRKDIFYEYRGIKFGEKHATPTS